jgi:hypothetical protein
MDMGLTRFNYFAYGSSLVSDVALHLPKSPESTAAKIQIQSAVFSYPKGQKTKVHRAGIIAKFAEDQHFKYLIWPDTLVFRINAEGIEYQQLAEMPQGLLSIFICAEALGILIFLKGHMLLHASCVLMHKKAQIFLGQPGAGKSTTVAAMAQAGFSVLGDDMVAIDFSSDKPKVHSGTDELKIWEDAVIGLGFDKSKLSPAWEGKNKFMFKQKHFPIDQSFILEKINILLKPKSRKKINEITFSQKMLIPTQYFALPHQLLKNQALSQFFRQSQILAQTCTYEHKKRPKNFEALRSWIQSQK